jgi:transposase
MLITKEVALRQLSPEERSALQELAHSRTAAVRLVERARLLLATADGASPSQVAREVGVSRPTVYAWIHRFNAHGLAGLDDRRRGGRPPTYTAEQRAEVIATALTDPRSLGLPFGCWTLDRLQAYLNEHRGIAIKRSRIDEILTEEGLRWRKQETWFGERVDPEFAEKKGRSSGSTPPLPPTRSSSASTRWGRSRPRASPAGNRSRPRPATASTKIADPPGGPSKRSTTGGEARGTSSAPSSRRPAKR